MSAAWHSSCFSIGPLAAAFASAMVWMRFETPGFALVAGTLAGAAALLAIASICRADRGAYAPAPDGVAQ